MYPDFMGKEPFQTYKSKKILGRLYCRIKDSYDGETAPYSEVGFSPKKVIYDQDLEVQGSTDFVADAWNQKCTYDGQISSLMAQYKVTREEEIVTGHVWSMPKSNSKKQDMEQLGDEERNKILEQKASAWYGVTYHPDWVKKSLELRGPIDTDNIEDQQVMLSFPWIAADYLARIKIRHTGIAEVDSSKPIASLAKYLSEMDLTST
ncbi:unnamed protein product [Rhodiola kirilowii]